MRIWWREAEILYRDAADQVFLNNPLEHVFGAAVVPDTVGPNDGDRACSADAQAICFGPCDAAIAVEPQFFQALLEVFPCRSADCRCAAFALLRFGTEENMAGDAVIAVGGESFAGFGQLVCKIVAHMRTI